MLIAQLNGTDVVQVADYTVIFPYTSFPESGPSNEWLYENSCAPVTVWVPYDPATQVLDAVAPYLQDGVVYTVVARLMTPEEKANYDLTIQLQNKATATSLLAATDWSEIPSVTDPANNPHLLNGADFVAYRNQLRVIAVNPPITPVTFPPEPVEQWS